MTSLVRVQTLQSLLLLAAPAGGQGTARRNARSGIAADARRGRQRRQAQEALAAADLRAYGRLGAHG